MVAPESGNLSLSSLANVTLRLSDVAGSVTSDGAGGLLRFARLISGLMDPAKAEKWLRSKGRRGSDMSGESNVYSSSGEDDENVESTSDSSSDESKSGSSSDESKSDSSSDESESESSSDESKSESSSDESEESEWKESQEISGESAEAIATTSRAISMDTTESGTGGSSELVELTTDDESGELREAEVAGIVFESREEAETTTLSPTGPSGGSGLSFDMPPHETHEKQQQDWLLRSERRRRGVAESDTEQSGPSAFFPVSGQSASAGAEERAEDVDSEAEGQH